MDNTSHEKSGLSRRDLLKATAVGGAGMLLSNALSGPAEAQTPSRPSGQRSVIGLRFEPRNRVRAAVIGVGGRGSSLLRDLLATSYVDINAICDIVPSKVKNAQATVVKAGQKEPAGFWAGDTDYENLLRRDDIDLVYIATPWRWHVPMAVYALDHGKHVGVEVPASSTLKGCWDLVNASERNQRHCVMLENCCYGDSEMLVLNMVRNGLFGDLTHGEAAYIHHLSDELLSDAGEGLWRRNEHWDRNGNLYPTHGLGPVAQYMDINRGDRFETIVSLSSLEHALTQYRDAHVPADSPKRKERYSCGDMNTSIIRTALGRTIMLQHDVVTPRPYSRHNMISGTKGTFAGFPDRIFLEGQESYDWQPIDGFQEKYASPLWTRIGELARKLGGHGGMDFVMTYRLVECLREGLVPDMDVYDAAAWSAPAPLSETSVKKGGAPQKFPDFTRGRWNEKRA